MFESISTQKTYQKIVEQIQNMILNGTFKSGDKLPAERELTEQLQVSRSSLREALKALEVLGLIESRHGEGSFITNNVEDTILKSVSIAYKLNEGTVVDILELRHCLEVYSVKHAVRNATENDIADLEQIVLEMSRAENMDQEEILDIRFHNEIIKMTDNILFQIIADSISDLMAPFIKSVRKIYSENDEKMRDYYFFGQHMNIVEGIKSRDEEVATKAIEDHLRLTEEDIIRLSVLN